MKIIFDIADNDRLPWRFFSAQLTLLVHLP